MTLNLTEKDYFTNYNEIQACLDGEMCKIMMIVDHRTDHTEFHICTDVTGGGWTSAQGRRFHGYDYDGETTWKGLGTFFLISVEKHPGPKPGTDRYILKFTDDLNPELP